MCTVTILPLEHGIRMAANRDESPLRSPALPPRVVTAGAHQALMPIDPQSGGTWIAATDAGLVFTLLNVYPSPHDRNAAKPKVSRGTIIPNLCRAATLDEAFAWSEQLNAEDFAAFRLVMADRRHVADVYCTGSSCTRNTPSVIDRPILFTSSGLGDGVVDPPRRALFDEYFAQRLDGRERQNAYHRHFWPDRRNVSVCMLRPEARTVSLTIVEMNATVQMDYFGDGPGQTTSPFSARIERRVV